MDTWADEEGAREFAKTLRRHRAQHVDMLIGAAKGSSDPVIQRTWAAIAQLDNVISMMEDERGKPDDQ